MYNQVFLESYPENVTGPCEFLVMYNSIKEVKGPLKVTGFKKCKKANYSLWGR